MARLEIPHELRSTMRARSKGSVHVRCHGRVIRGRMIDLAVSGICVRADLPTGSTRLIGERVCVDLRFDADEAKQLALVGRVLRVSISTGTMAIRIDEFPDDFEDCVQGELLAAMEHDVMPRMILVDDLDARRTVIASAFRRAGCHVTETSTPLEAISYLDRSRFELGLIAIADTVPETVAEQLRGFLLREHPDAHMIAIGRSASHRDPAESWLSSTNVRGDLQIRVGRVMTAHGSRRQSTMSWDSPSAFAGVD